MKARILLPLGCFLLASAQPLSAQYVTGLWLVNEGSGTNIHNTSPNTSNWGMTLLPAADPNLWNYWQPGAYAFANGNNNAATVLTSAAAWTSGDNLALKADFNVTGNLHDSGSVFTGGAVFGGGYWLTTGGNSLGYNFGAFYAVVNTVNPAAPYIEFDVSGLGQWSQALPTSVCNPAVNGGWNTAEWDIVNNKASLSMTLQFRLNGAAVGAPVNITGGYLEDFSDRTSYNGTKFYIGAAADQSYTSFRGSISNVSLVTLSSPAFTTTPTNQYAFPGSNVTFTAVASARRPCPINGFSMAQTSSATPPLPA